MLRSFNPILTNGAPRTENYFFDQAGVDSFNLASLFGAKLGSWVTQGSAVLEAAGTSMANMIIVMREKEPTQALGPPAQVTWARAYGFADGHAEIHVESAQDRFANWEKERIVPSQ